MSPNKSSEKFREHEVQALLELESFIASNPNPRELKRAVAIRMLMEGICRETIQTILGVSSPFISKWKINYALLLIEGLRLKHQGSQGQLKPEEREEILQWLTNQNHWDLSALRNYIAERYQIEFQSKTSYYQLFKSAGISWKKSQKKNPKRDEELVKKKHEEICKNLEEHREAIESGTLVVYLIDECHLLWGDVCGYLWGKRNERIEIPLVNEREKQTYYGAINLLRKQLVLREYASANSENTVAFLKDLQSLNPAARHLIIWDGASYHRYKEMKAYLEEINLGKEKDEWPLTCILFAPNAPEQNPVEDIWLNAKTWLRKFGKRLSSFSLVKWFFNFTIQEQSFDFPKLHKFGDFEPTFS
ncbi:MULTISPECIES: IS630 family transposase [unclassified Microcoleus]|uniref:IS630 family transposase n=1 Tax=unclassified Microcoleus TaxID=2642155 RepID=UPI002FD478C0